MDRKKKAAPARTPQLCVINVKGSAEYSAWLDAATHETRIPKASLFRLGMELVAKQYGLDPPPES